MSLYLPPSSEATPEQAFYYAWIADLLDYALTETKKECCDAGLEIHWQVFHRRIVAPIFEDAEGISFNSICQTYGIESESKACNMVVTVIRRFREVLRRRLRDLTGSDSKAEAEFEEILMFLSESGAGL